MYVPISRVLLCVVEACLHDTKITKWNLKKKINFNFKCLKKIQLFFNTSPFYDSQNIYGLFRQQYAFDINRKWNLNEPLNSFCLGKQYLPRSYLPNHLKNLYYQNDQIGVVEGYLGKYKNSQNLGNSTYNTYMWHVPPNYQMQTVDGRQNIQAQEQQQTRLEQQRCSRRQRNHISKFSDWKMLPVTLLKRSLQHCAPLTTFVTFETHFRHLRRLH